GTGQPWRAHRVASVRYQYRVPTFPQGQDWLPLRHTAAQLEVSATVVTRLRTPGTRPASQVVPLAPGIMRRADLDRAAVDAAVQAVQASRLRPHRPSLLADFPLQASDVAGGGDEASSSPTRPPPAAPASGVK